MNNGSLPFICSMPTTVPLFSLRWSESGWYTSDVLFGCTNATPTIEIDNNKV